MAFCEIEEFPRKVLAKHWPEVPIYEDVRQLTGEQVGPVDVICGGYPCQPDSLAGKRLGEEDHRYLWPEFARLVSELRPTWIIGENVVGHISMGLDGVLADLEMLLYSARAFVIPALAVGAKHQRERTWVVAYNESDNRHVRENGKLATSRTVQRELGGSDSDVSNAFVIRLPRQRRPVESLHSAQEKQGKKHRAFDDSGWLFEPDVGRVANGVPFGVDRNSALGNAVVPQIPELIGHSILEAIEASK